MYLVKYTIKRLVMLIPVILGVTLILYFVMSLAPGNPARQILGADATAEQVAALEHEMGLDKPIIVQYINYILGVVRLDFGTSWVTGLEVLESFRQRLPDTFFLALCSTLWAVALGIPLGIASAVKQYSLLDYGFMLLAMLLFSFPPFWLALLCQLLFCLTLGWLAGDGRRQSQPLHPARPGAGGEHPGLHDTHEPHQHARRAAAGLHPHRPLQGRLHAPGC